MIDSLAAALAATTPVNEALREPGQAHLDNLTKPRGSLGRLEELALALYLVADGAPPAAHPARIYTVAGDHGVAAEKVSLFPQEVTRQMVANFLAGGAGINALCGVGNIDLKVVDAGVAGGEFDEHPNLVRAKIAPGTANIAGGPAMSLEQCVQALDLGVSLASQAAARGYKAVGTGDMGIANTTPSTALFCAHLGLDPAAVAGPGTGLDQAGVAHKAKVVETALCANERVLRTGDPVDVLAALGGFEIATLAGLIIGAGANRLAVAVDGFISTAAWLCAVRICPDVKGYCVLSHASAEPGYARIMAALGQRPLLDLGLRLGEGTGAALALHLMRSAAAVFNDMATFDKAGVSK